MSRKWKKVWTEKVIEGNDYRIENLLKITGFDSIDDAVDVERYRAYISSLISKLNISFNESVYEFGCGCGGFLYMLQEQASSIKYSGSDCSPAMIETARSGLPEGCFECAEAVEISSIPKYDYVFANNVFYYFS